MVINVCVLEVIKLSAIIKLPVCAVKDKL